MKEFLLRFSVLAQLQQFWMDGHSYLKVIICSEEDAEIAATSEGTLTLAMKPSTVEDYMVEDGYSDAASDATIDLKPTLTDQSNETAEESVNGIGGRYSLHAVLGYLNV